MKVLTGVGIATVVIVGALAVPAAGAQNGTLVGSSEVKLDATTLASLGTSSAEARRVAKLVEVRKITYMSDGLRVAGYLAVPRSGDTLPCVIFNRGGNRSYGALSDGDAVVGLGGTAARGYVVVGSQYRGNEGGEGQEEFGGADVDDVLNLIPLLESQPRADASRIGMVGVSRGGMMTYLALARTDRIAAAVVNSGMSDLVDLLRRRPDMEAVYADLIPGYPENGQGSLEARSAVRWAEKLCKRTPILILHGTADTRIDPAQALAMATSLLETNHPLRLVLYEGDGHGLPQHALEAQRLTREWLDRYVRDRQPVPQAGP